jgi:alkylation response protein AidB-like acyl-CoA dehydrogenase
MLQDLQVVWTDLARELGERFEARAGKYDENDAFVEANYADLKEHRFFAALVPTELGGEGATYTEMCHALRILAQHCPSTALAQSMHQHLVAANVWKLRRGQNTETLLRKVADQQIVLVSTGGRDWLESSGKVTRVEGGFLVSAFKAFSSQSAVGDLLMTSAPYEDPERGWQVLHFGVPFVTEGLQVLDDWKALGMRSTGSHTVTLDEVFVPEAAISLRRPRGEFHPSFNIVTAVAITAVMGVYLGIAQKGAKIAIDGARRQKSLKPHIPAALGEMHNALSMAELAWNDMLWINDDYGFEAVDAVGQDISTRKVIVTNACIQTVTLAMEIVGGIGFSREFGLEKLFRDVQAAKYHPYPEKEQQAYRGAYLLRSGEEE